MIDEKREEVKVNAERSDKAEWAISLCNCRNEELEAWINEERERREKLEGTLDSDRKCIEEAKNYVEKGITKLRSLELVQEDLSNKVKATTEAKLVAEAELETVVLQRGEILMEIEKLRNQRNVFNRRIEFCKEKEVIGLLSKEEVKCGYREYVPEDIRSCTESFSDRLRLKSGGNWTNVYRGRIDHTTVAVKVIGDCLSDEDFGAKVKLLNDIRHPNLVAIAGFCSQRPKCILFEYMHNGNLRDNLFTSQRKTRKCKILKWHDTIRIAHQVCSGLGFLHSVKPKPIIHGRLTPSKILLDRNLVPKITGFGLIMHSDQSDTKPDVMAFRVLLLHLLTGRNWPGLLKAMSMNQTSILRDLDQTAGKWPLELAKEFGALAVKCFSVNRGGNMDFSTKEIMEELDKIRGKADELKIIGGYEEATNSNTEEGDLNDIPSDVDMTSKNLDQEDDGTENLGGDQSEAQTFSPSTFRIIRKTPKDVSAQMNIKKDFKNSAINWRTFLAHSESHTKKNQRIISSDEGDTNFTSQVYSSRADLDLCALFGVQRLNEEDLSCKPTWNGILIHERRFESWFHAKPRSHERDINFSSQPDFNQPALNLPALFGEPRLNQKISCYQTNLFGISTHQRRSGIWNHIKPNSYEGVIEFTRQGNLNLPYLEAQHLPCKELNEINDQDQRLYSDLEPLGSVNRRLSCHGIILKLSRYKNTSTTCLMKLQRLVSFICDIFH